MAEGLPRDATGLRKLKAMGSSDKRLAYLALQSAHLPGGPRGAAYGRGLIHATVKALGARNMDGMRANLSATLKIRMRQHPNLRPHEPEPRPVHTHPATPIRKTR